MLVPVFSDPEQMPAVSTGTVPGYEAEPGGQMVAIVEVQGIPNSTHQGHSGFGAYPLYLGDWLAHPTLLKHTRDSLIEVGDANVNLLPELIEVSEDLTEERREALVSVLEDLRNQEASRDYIVAQALSISLMLE